MPASINEKQSHHCTHSLPLEDKTYMRMSSTSGVGSRQLTLGGLKSFWKRLTHICVSQTTRVFQTLPLGKLNHVYPAWSMIWVLVSSHGVGVTKAPFVNFSVSKIFDLAKVYVILLESHSYLTGVTAAELRRHPSNINAIFNSLSVFWRWWKIGKITERKKIA